MSLGRWERTYSPSHRRRRAAQRRARAVCSCPQRALRRRRPPRPPRTRAPSTVARLIGKNNTPSTRPMCGSPLVTDPRLSRRASTPALVTQDERRYRAVIAAKRRRSARQDEPVRRRGPQRAERILGLLLVCQLLRRGRRGFGRRFLVRLSQARLARCHARNIFAHRTHICEPYRAPPLLFTGKALPIGPIPTGFFFNRRPKFQRAWMPFQIFKFTGKFSAKRSFFGEGGQNFL